MGVFDDAGRVWDVASKNKGPGIVDGMRQAASAAEAAQAMKEQMAASGGMPPGLNGQGFNPCENLQGMWAAPRGPGAGPLGDRVAREAQRQPPFPFRRSQNRHRGKVNQPHAVPNRHRAALARWDGPGAPIQFAKLVAPDSR